MKKFKVVLAVLLIIALIGGGAYAFNLFKNASNKNSILSDDSNAEINIAYLTKSIEKIGEIRTAKITYGCMTDFEQGKYPVLTKSAFSMYYKATAEAGINIDEVTIKQDGNGKYIIQLPEPKLFEPQIDMSSIKLFTKSNAIFNRLKPEDLQEALKIAQDDVTKQAATDQILEIANDKAVSVLENFLSLILDKSQFEIIPYEIES